MTRPRVSSLGFYSWLVSQVAALLLLCATTSNATLAIIPSRDFATYNAAILQRAPYVVVGTVTSITELPDVRMQVHLTVDEYLKGGPVPGDTLSFVYYDVLDFMWLKTPGARGVFGIWACRDGTNSAYVVGSFGEDNEFYSSISTRPNPRQWPSLRDTLLSVCTAPASSVLAATADACVRATITSVNEFRTDYRPTELVISVDEVLRAQSPPDTTGPLVVQLPRWYTNAMQWEHRFLRNQEVLLFLHHQDNVWTTIPVGNPIWLVKDGMVSLPITCLGTSDSASVLGTTATVESEIKAQ